MRKSIALAVASATALLFGGRAVVLACAPAPHAGDHITIVEEAAVIVWDPATKTEHFIRRATFGGNKARDFGFLVPTPTTPTLAEVDDNIFDQLEAKTQRQTIYRRRKQIDWTPLLAFMTGMRSENRATSVVTDAVTVLATQKIAGYDAVVLEASDAGALRKWLSDHGYASTDDLTKWLEAYVKQKWKITAFKIDSLQRDLAPRTSAVKMSFTTGQPFFPYREPASQRQVSSDEVVNRSLRIWFLGPERVRAVIGANTFWPAELRRSESLDLRLRADVMRMASVALPVPVRMTAFEDYLRIRPGDDDLFFSRSLDQNAFIPAPKVIEDVEKVHIPLDFLILVIIVIVVAGWRARR